jgi:type 2 lantibiotic biosynthesis protein LanM
MDSQTTSFLETADAIGAGLCRDALRDGNRANWMGDSKELIRNDWKTAYKAMGPDLYTGTAGIALFLARLYKATGEKMFRSTAEAAANHSLSRLDDVPAGTSASLYLGRTGIAYALSEAGEALGNDGLIKKALEVLKPLAKEDVEGQGLDVVAGSAGAIPGLLNLYDRHSKPFILDTAVRHGERLLKKAHTNGTGSSWDTVGTGITENQLTGFSHGTAGIAWALFELFRHTGEQKFRAAAEQGVNYERHHFSPEQQNWPDFRGLHDDSMGTGGGVVYPVAWCHGAVGIGLSRLRFYDMLKDETYRQESEAALHTTVNLYQQHADMVKGDFSLCHGAAGNAELTLYASRILKNDDYRKVAEWIGERGIQEFHSQEAPWPCGVLEGGETPGLMLGLAGIGYFYLRLHDPEGVPPVVIILPKAK